jgi:hypothetical protein
MPSRSGSNSRASSRASSRGNSDVGDEGSSPPSSHAQQQLQRSLLGRASLPTHQDLLPAADAQGDSLLDLEARRSAALSSRQQQQPLRDEEAELGHERGHDSVMAAVLAMPESSRRTMVTAVAAAPATSAQEGSDDYSEYSEYEEDEFDPEWHARQNQQQAATLLAAAAATHRSAGFTEKTQSVTSAADSSLRDASIGASSTLFALRRDLRLEVDQTVNLVGA